MCREFLPRTEPYRQSKLYANCKSSLTIVVLTEIIKNAFSAIYVPFLIIWNMLRLKLQSDLYNNLLNAKHAHIWICVEWKRYVSPSLTVKSISYSIVVSVYFTLFYTDLSELFSLSNVILIWCIKWGLFSQKYCECLFVYFNKALLQYISYFVYFYLIIITIKIHTIL